MKPALRLVDSLVRSLVRRLGCCLASARRSTRQGLATSWPVGAALCVFLSSGQMAVAQTLRDPTLAPSLPSSAVGPAAPAPTARALKTLALVSGPLTLIERDGRLHVVLDGRLYAEGQNVGQVHIERLRETEVWFRDGVALYKMSRFPGIQRRSALPDVAAGSSPGSGSGIASDAPPDVALPVRRIQLPSSHLP